MTTVLVWSRSVRLLHAGLIVSVALATLGTVAWFGLHRPAGYAALVVAGLRVGLGCAGSGAARFVNFLRGPRATFAYACAVWRGLEAHHLGHNPLGGWMILLLLGCVVGLGATGWLYTSDRFFGDATVELLHRGLAWLLWTGVALHVAGVLFTGRRQRENLVGAMLHGRKRCTADPDEAALEALDRQRLDHTSPCVATGVSPRESALLPQGQALRFGPHGGTETGSLRGRAQPVPNHDSM